MSRREMTQLLEEVMGTAASVLRKLEAELTRRGVSLPPTARRKAPLHRQRNGNEKFV